MLYLEIDGKGYMVKDRGLSPKTRKRGDIFAYDERKIKPQLVRASNAGKPVYIFYSTFCFGIPPEKTRECGTLNLILKPDSNQSQLLLDEMRPSFLLYSPKYDRSILVDNEGIIGTPEFIIEKLDTVNQIMAASINFSCRDLLKPDTSQCRIYFDLEIDYIE